MYSSSNKITMLLIGHNTSAFQDRLWTPELIWLPQDRKILLNYKITVSKYENNLNMG